VQREPTRPAVSAGGRVDVLEVLALVLGDARAGEAGRFGVGGEQPGHERRAAPVQPAHEDDAVILRAHSRRPA
jgi:hypothetical protein